MLKIMIFALLGIYVGVKFHEHNEEVRRETERHQKAMLAKLKLSELKQDDAES